MLPVQTNSTVNGLCADPYDTTRRVWHVVSPGPGPSRRTSLITVRSSEREVGFLPSAPFASSAAPRCGQFAGSAEGDGPAGVVGHAVVGPSGVVGPAAVVGPAEVAGHAALVDPAEEVAAAEDALGAGGG